MRGAAFHPLVGEWFCEMFALPLPFKSRAGPTSRPARTP